ncbi:MAG: class I SAM-dependent methyltransferase [Ignavibacteria bacterium]|nr:class I SAM-dependent methyltransferase [Ignavibacteria bacterium]
MIKEKLKDLLPGSIWNILQWGKKNLLAFKYRFIGRPFIPGETTKAYSRRLKEGFFENYCKGVGLDIGFGSDLVTKNAKGYDFEHGNAQYLKGMKDNSYDFVYSSHTIEHLPDPAEGVKNWFRVVKPGGYLAIYLPHRDLYEKKKTLPSNFNLNHRHFFLIDRDELPDTIGIVPLIERTLNDFEIIYAKECNEGHTITDPDIHSDGEFSIEVVIRKKIKEQ